MALERKVIIKENGILSHKEYSVNFNDHDDLLYYVYYSPNMDENKKFYLFTNPSHFGKRIIIRESTNRDELAKIADAINQVIRILAE